MEKIKHIFVINPNSGKGTEQSPLCAAIRDACAVAGADYEIYMTSAPGDATRFVREKIKSKPLGEVFRFYACGGDGTLSEVVSGAANLNALTNPRPIAGVEIGCIPIGTGNDFVRNFSHTEFFLDVTKQLLADAIEIDSYYCKYDNNECVAINMINIGFDSDVVVKVVELKKKWWIPKSLAYIAGVVVTLKKNLGRHITVTYPDGKQITKEFELVSAANGGWCGGGFHSAPKSSLTDGLLDVSLIDKVSRITLLRIIGAYKKGTHLDTKLGKKLVSYIQDSGVKFEIDSVTNICIDGELKHTKNLELTVLPKSLSFAVPVGCECIYK